MLEVLQVGAKHGVGITQVEKVVWYNGMVGQTGPKKRVTEKGGEKQTNTCLVLELCTFHKIGCVSSRKDLPTHELVYAQNAFNSLGKTQSMQFVISALRCPFHKLVKVPVDITHD